MIKCLIQFRGFLSIICKKHGYIKAIYPKGRLARCSKCASEAVTKRRRKVKQMAIEYKGSKCIKCGYSKSSWALDFHHTDPMQKEFGVGSHGLSRSWSRIKLELDKCILVCRNCHAEIHEEIGIN